MRLNEVKELKFHHAFMVNLNSNQASPNLESLL